MKILFSIALGSALTASAVASGWAAQKGAPGTRITPGQGTLAPTVAGPTTLTVGECKKLGCKVLKDFLCPTVNKKQQRCVCEGGGNLCIDEKSGK